MKLTGIICIFLNIQASASFFDGIRSAMSNVERSFGKLFSDVVVDVKDTIQCTISTVEQALVLNGLLDKSSTYSYRCRDFNKNIQPTPLTPSNIRDQRRVFDQLSRLKDSNQDFERRNSPKRISMELEKSIVTVNKTIDTILSHHQESNNLENASKTMKEETNRLTEISNILQRELNNISINIKLQIKKSDFNHHESNVESVWNEIKTLYDIQQSSKNATEINETRNILDKVVHKLNLNSEDHNISSNYNLKDIRKILQKYSSANDKESDANSRIQNRSLENSVTENKPKTFKDVTKTILNQNKNLTSNNQTTTGKSLNSELDSLDYFTPFSKTDTNDKKTINEANSVIEDSLRADEVLKNLFNEHQSGDDVFNDF